MPDAETILAWILDRARREYGDYSTIVAEDHPLDGSSRVVQLTNDVIEPTDIDIRLNGTVLAPTDFKLDATNGRVVLTILPASGAVLSVTGTSWQFVPDDELASYAGSAMAKHLHGRVLESISVDTNGFRRFSRVLQDVGTLPQVEWHPVALLTALEALDVIIADAAYDIAVSTAEGTNLARGERFVQLERQRERLAHRYRELCALLNVGLWRIQSGTLRRVSRTTERLVPLYPAREVDDNSLSWNRWLPPREFPAELVQGDQPMDVQRFDPQVQRGQPWSTDLTFPFSTTGRTVSACITLGAGSRQEQWGQVLRPPPHNVDVLVTTRDEYHVTLNLAGAITATLPSTAPWRVEVDGVPYLAGTFITQEEP